MTLWVGWGCDEGGRKVAPLPFGIWTLLDSLTNKAVATGGRIPEDSNSKVERTMWISNTQIIIKYKIQNQEYKNYQDPKYKGGFLKSKDAGQKISQMKNM